MNFTINSRSPPGCTKFSRFWNQSRKKKTILNIDIFLQCLPKGKKEPVLKWESSWHPLSKECGPEDGSDDASICAQGSSGRSAVPAQLLLRVPELPRAVGVEIWYFCFKSHQGGNAKMSSFCLLPWKKKIRVFWSRGCAQGELTQCLSWWELPAGMVPAACATAQLEPLAASGRAGLTPWMCLHR